MRVLAGSFYAENGLRVLNEWLADGVRRKEPGTSREKKRVEMFSQVRALIRVRGACWVLWSVVCVAAAYMCALM